MLKDDIKKLDAARAEVARLEQRVAAERRREFRELPGRYGFSSMAELVQALRAIAPPRRRARAIITNATRAAVKNLARAGKATAEIARSVGISPSSVQQIKKQAGLVKARQ
jgi:DNA-binding CsgD family transcriptional regulator